LLSEGDNTYTENVLIRGKVFPNFWETLSLGSALPKNEVDSISVEKQKNQKGISSNLVLSFVKLVLN
jgi:hypothetical protein